MSFMAASCICGDNMGFCMSRPVTYIAPEEIEEIRKRNQNIENEIAIDKVKNKKIDLFAITFFAMRENTMTRVDWRNFLKF